MLESLRGRLIVSCQAAVGSPLDSPAFLAALAQCAERAGAAAIRANHGPNIAAIRAAIGIPVIGLKKRDTPGSEVYITPEWADVLEAANAGADIVAIDATLRPRPVPFIELARRVHEDLGLLVMADVDTREAGIAAAAAGADLVATTMCGYTAATADQCSEPDLELVAALSHSIPAPVVCEGRVHTPGQARAALEAGAFAVVVGTAITAPDWITGEFIKSLSVEYRRMNPASIHKNPADAG